MLTHGSILVSILWLVEQIPTPSPSAKRQRGRQETYADKLFVKALIVMIIRRLYTAYALLNFGSLVLSGVRNYLISQANKEYPARSRWIRWNKCPTFKMP